MLALNFREELVITLIDKAVIGVLLVFAAYPFNRSLEAFKGTQSRELAKLTQEQTRSLEEFKSRVAAQGESLRGVRMAVAEVAKRMAAANHSISWVCWKATFSPASFTLHEVDKMSTWEQPRVSFAMIRDGDCSRSVRFTLRLEG